MVILTGGEKTLTARDAKENQGEICIDMRTQYRPVQAYRALFVPSLAFDLPWRPLR
jgi:hypothetical protein